jgi:hypothetical protein
LNALCGLALAGGFRTLAAMTREKVLDSVVVVRRLFIHAPTVTASAKPHNSVPSGTGVRIVLQSNRPRGLFATVREAQALDHRSNVRRDKARRIIVHASHAFVNGAGVADCEDLQLLNTLLSSPGEKGKVTPDNERRAPKPDSFKNDPPDPKNPNEVREKHLKKIKQ